MSGVSSAPVQVITPLSWLLDSGNPEGVDSIGTVPLLGQAMMNLYQGGKGSQSPMT